MFALRKGGSVESYIYKTKILEEEQDPTRMLQRMDLKTNRSYLTNKPKIL